MHGRMNGDRSLDEFVSGGDESSTESDDEVGDAVGSDAEESSETVAPAASTYAWSPSGEPCDACGAAVERRWRDEGDLVCGDCKSW